ncbi:23S rRNA (uracil(1939)-C(5))-methyltransferase RlmD [Parasporobacterium paucivorans]|nr:23S rRNA (uracil(1939)-C(5))-methyltransferase RlmD [Parasporobacterium paucivorans]
MKKGDVFEGLVIKTEFPNKGLMEIDGNKIRVKGVLAGQKIRFSIKRKRSGQCEGKLMEVLEKSPLQDREAPCIHFGKCGGCSYQDLSYGNQLEMKSAQVKEILDSVCPDYLFEGILPSPSEWEYRNKMEFSFGDEFMDGPLALGLHRKNSFHDIVNITDCRIVDNDFNEILKCVLNHFDGKEIPFYHKMRHEGYLRHLLVRRAATTGEILINLVTASGEAENAVYEAAADYEGLIKALLALSLNGTIVGIAHVINDSMADVVKSDQTDSLFGRDYIQENILGLNFKVSAFSFFQTNSLGAEVLYGKARQYAGETKDKVIFDLYSGTGTIAQMLAPIAKKTVGVEIVGEAVEAARINAAGNNLNNCEFIVGDVLKVMDDLQDKPELIILDPPRDGVHPKALEKIAEFGADTIVYISCKPSSLERDMYSLQEAGYKVVKACAVDMFPQTVHVETVVMLTRSEATK